MANATGFTPQQLQHLNTILCALIDKRAFPSHIDQDLLWSLQQKALAEFEQLQATHGLVVGKDYRVDAAHHWAHGRRVVIDRVNLLQGAIVEFHSLDDVPGYSYLHASCFKPFEEPIALVVGKTYHLNGGNFGHVGNVVVVKLCADLSTAVVHPEGKPDEKFACLCVNLKALQP